MNALLVEAVVKGYHECPGGGGGGGTRSIHDGGSDVFFWVENLHARYFLGQEICHVFF